MNEAARDIVHDLRDIIERVTELGRDADEAERLTNVENIATRLIDQVERRKRCPLCLRELGHDLDCAVGDLKAALR